MKGGRRHFGKRGGTPEKGKNGGDNNLHDGRWDQAFHPKDATNERSGRFHFQNFANAHFAVFPEILVATCIKATCPENGVVLDPFSGAGTTALAAKSLGRDFIAIDCVAEYCKIAKERLQDSLKKSA